MLFEQPSIKGFVGERKSFFKIPEFQRPYSWEPKNAFEMLEDLERCVRVPEKGHYFGTIFYTNDKTAYTIIDGQQRITTTLLLIMAVYHLIDKYPEKGKGGDDPHNYYTKDDISDEFLYDHEFSKVKLRTVAYDDRIFQDIYETGGERLSKEEKRSNLWRVYKTFYDYFDEKDTLNQYINALDNFRVVKIGLQENIDDEPQRVFESINSTGQPLTDGDKIRNFALMLDNEEMRKYVYNEYWSEIERALTDPDKDEITDFFRSYLIAKRQAVIQTTEVYTEFKKFFAENIKDQTDKKSIDDFYGEITEYLNYYLLLVLGEETHSQKYRKTQIPLVAKHMRYIRSGLYVPFGMSVMAWYNDGKISSKELDDVFMLIETYFSRRLVCNISAASLDKVFASLHEGIVQMIEVEVGANYVEVMKFMLLKRTGQTRLPNDNELMLTISNNDFYNQRHNNVMYVLCAANDIHRPKSSNVLGQVMDGTLKLSVEHIMPQTIIPKDKNGAKWVKMLGDDWAKIHESYLHTLGNLTITGYNAEYSNLPYVDAEHPERSKMHLVDKHGDHVGLADNDFIMNQYIANNFPVWNEEAILKRQKWWMKSFQRMWPYPVTDFSPVVSDKSVSLLQEMDYKGYSIFSINILGNYYVVSQWSDAMDYIAETLYEQDTKLFKTLLDDEFLSKYIVREKTAPHGAMQVLETDFYVYVNNDTNTKIKIIKALSKIYKLEPDDIKADILKRP